jgi:protein involved in polysaccharide export with SLBB domain
MNGWRRSAAVIFVTLLPCWAGCTAFRPLKGVPVQYFPHELRGDTRGDKETIDLSLLRQTPPETYLVDSGDVLAIYIEGVLGRREEIPPVFFPQNNEVPPSLGYPIPIRDDGTISLPLIKPLHVRSMTLTQVEEAIRKSYTIDKQILQAGQDRILVSLQRPRMYTVLVIRQEGSTTESGQGGMGGIMLGAVKRGTGKLVKLPAGENDVLHALAETGGLPGLDARNEIVILRRRKAASGANCPQVPEFHGRGGDSTTNLIRQTSGVRGGDGFGHTPVHAPTPRTPVNIPSGRVVAQRDPSPPPVSRTPAPQIGAPPAADFTVPSPWEGQPPGLIQPGVRTPSGVRPMPPVAAPVSPSPTPVPHQAPPTSHPPTTPPALISPTPASPGAPKLPRPPMHPAPEPPSPAVPYQGPLPSQIQGFDWASPDAMRFVDWNGKNRDVIRIPVRMAPGEQPQVTEQDIILEDGDIVFIESRDTEVFYTGGLLGGGQYQLPRDYDLDVLSAISIATARQASSTMGGGFANRMGGISSMNQDISVSASDVVILRQMPDGNQIPIKTDLNKALRDPKYRIRIQPGDYLILQYKPHEAVAAFVERNLLAGSLFSLAAVGNRGGSN